MKNKEKRIPFTIFVTPLEHKHLKTYAAIYEKSMNEVVIEALKKHILSEPWKNQ